MSSRPLISIGVTTFRRPVLLQETLTSVLSQDFGDFEVLVGNDDVGGPLSPQELGIIDSRVKVINRPKNLGELGNMNALLAESNGQYFTWLADDDLHLPGFLRTAARCLLEHPELQVFFSSYATGSAPKVAAAAPSNGQILTGREFLSKYLSRDLMAVGCYGVWKTEYLRTLGGMKKLGTGFSPYSDALLVLEASQLPAVGYSKTPLVFFRAHSESISNSSADLNAYVTAQLEFCAAGVPLLRASAVQEDLAPNQRELLTHWCVEHFFSVVGRSRSLQLGLWAPYFGALARYAQFTKGGRFLFWLRSAWSLRLLIRARLARLLPH